MDIYGTWVVTEVAWAALATATRAEAEAAEEAEHVVAIWQNAEVMEAETGREDVVWRDWKNTNWREAREEAETARAQVKAEWAKAKTRLRS